jgi:hypothetical protein
LTDLDLESYRRRAEEFVGELDKEHYLHYAGLNPEANFAAVYDRYPELFTAEAVKELDRLYAMSEGDEKKRLAYLLELTVAGFFGAETKELSDEIANTEARAKVEIDGESVPYRYSSVVQANEADRERRMRIHAARLDVIADAFNPLYDDLWRRSHALAQDLGYEDYESLFSEIKGIDYGLLRGQTDALLQDTEGVYQRSLDRLVEAKMGLTLKELHVADLPYLMRAPEYDAVFAADRLVPTFSSLLADMGIDLAAQTNVHLDAQPRELKTPRAFCAPVRVPGEIYLVVMPKGGQDDFQALLHEGGHTEHFAHARPELAFEYRHLGDMAVTEGYAFIMDHLVLNSRWLERYLDFVDSSEFVTFATIVDLYFLRRYCGKLAYETELHKETGSLDGMARVYGERLSEALLIDVPPESYLVDVDPGFYAGDYLRAWMFEGAFRMMLQDRYGMEWFRDPAGCAWLKGLWAKGAEFGAERLTLMCGGGKLDFHPLQHLIERNLGR